jgi:hypothetical protein
VDGQGQQAMEPARGDGLSAAWRSVLPVVRKMLLAVVTLLLLGSLGGAAAYASPVTLPLLFLAARFSRRTAEGILWAVLAAATALETAWLLTFVTLGESAPWIWLLPMLAAITTGTVVYGARAIHRTRG